MSREPVALSIKDFSKGDGPALANGSCVGDSWVQTTGPHSECEGKIEVLGLGAYLEHGKVKKAALLRCWGCFFSWTAH